MIQLNLIVLAALLFSHLNIAWPAYMILATLFQIRFNLSHFVDTPLNAVTEKEAYRINHF